MIFIFYRLKRMSVLGSYIDSQWCMARFTVQAEQACICAFGKPSEASEQQQGATAAEKVRQSVIGK